MNLVNIGHFLIQGPFVFISVRVIAITSGFVVSDEWIPWYSMVGATCLVVRFMGQRKRRHTRRL